MEECDDSAILWKHESELYGIERLSSRLIVTAAEDGTLPVIDFDTGDCVRRLGESQPFKGSCVCVRKCEDHSRFDFPNLRHL